MEQTPTSAEGRAEDAGTVSETFEFDIRQHQTGPGGAVRVRLHIRQATAMILFPSLTCPALVKEGEPVRLLIAAEEWFYQTHQADRKVQDFTGAHSSRMLLRLVAQHLKIRPFDDSLSDKIRPLVQDRPLLASASDAAQRLSVQYLGPLGSALRTVGGEERFVGYLRPEILDLCRRQRLTRLFQIVYQGPELTSGPTGALFDASWLIRTNRPQGQITPEHEPQDAWTLQFLEQDPYIGDSDFKYEIDVDSPEIDFTPRKDRPIRNFHPIWIGPANKPVLNPGHLTDVHVSSRQHAFTRVRPQLLPGYSPDIAARVNTSFETLRDLMDQFGEDPEVDFLFFTGDLIDYNRNYNPTPFLKGEKRTTGALWQAMNLDHLNARDASGQPVRDGKGHILPNTKDYPRGIDNAVMYSLFLRFMRKYGKPVFLVAGNHEAYTVPYGISARIHKEQIFSEKDNPEKAVEESRQTQARRREALQNGQADKGIKRANPGMPADHNLSIPEAILLYGPDFNRVIISNNFKSRNLDWFYTVFSPIQDFYFTWGEQCVIGLGWGDEEQYLAMPYSRGRQITGFLPWATESLSDRQLQLVESALQAKRRANLLACHFTLVNYDAPVPIAEEGEVNFNDTASVITHHSEGTFTNNRKPLYRLLLDGAFSCTLSGHSHRAAHYRITARDDGLVRHDFNVRGQAPCPRTGRYQPCPDGPQILVSASGGPIPVQNHHGELAGQGLDIPSGTQIRFSPEGKITDIRVRRTRNPKAKPRLSVVLDYADLLGGEDTSVGPLFSRFAQETDNGPFIIEVNPKMGLPKMQWIESIAVLKRTGKRVERVRSSLQYDIARNLYELRVDGEDIDASGVRAKTRYYVEVRASQNLKNIDPYTVYSMEDPWIWQARIISRQKEALKQLHQRLDATPGLVPRKVVEELEQRVREKNQGMEIQRDPKHGEIPDLRAYSRYFGKEYAFPWADKKPGTRTRKK